MPIVTLQRQFRELGRIRLGHQVEFERNGVTKKLPEKLETWRLTSPDRSLLEAAAAQYEGEVVDWPEAPDGDEFQLITKAREIEIIVPPRSLSQWNEMWSGGGCQRRCDGEREWLRNTPCLCPADPTERNELASKGEACKPTTRLQVILPQLPDLGTWLLVTHGYYAAVELAGTAELLAAAAASGGRMVNASLWIDQRTVKRPGQPTRKFPVPAIRIPETMTALLAGGNGGPALLTGRVPAQLTTSAPLPEDPSFDSPSAGETASDTRASVRHTEASTTPPAAPCPHPQASHQATDVGIVCGACGVLLAQRDQPQPGSSGPAAVPEQPAANVSPPPGDAPPAPTTMPDAQSRVARLAIQHRMVEQMQNDADWARFDEVLRTHGVEPPPLEVSPEAIAEWNALGDRIVRGDFDAPVGDDPAGMCQAHQLSWKFVPAGTNRAGKNYRSFWTCPDPDCSNKPTKAWRDQQPEKAGQEVGA